MAKKKAEDETPGFPSIESTEEFGEPTISADAPEEPELVIQEKSGEFIPKPWPPEGSTAKGDTRVKMARRLLDEARENLRIVYHETWHECGEEERVKRWRAYCSASVAAKVFSYHGRPMDCDYPDNQYRGEEFLPEVL